MKKGSITVFSALCMSFVLSTLFVLLEAARFYGLSQYAYWKGRQGVECVAAEYQPYLWEEFHLLMLDSGYSTEFFEIGNVTGRMKEKLDENLNQKNFGWQFPDMNLFQMETSHIYEPKYLLVTDADGEVLLDMISAYMKKNLPREAAEEIRQRYINQNDMKNNTTNVEETIYHQLFTVLIVNPDIFSFSAKLFCILHLIREQNSQQFYMIHRKSFRKVL